MYIRQAILRLYDMKGREINVRTFKICEYKA